MMIHDSAIYVLSGGLPARNVREEVANLLWLGLRTGRSLGVDTEDLFGLEVYVRATPEGAEARRLLVDMIADTYKTGKDGDALLGAFPVLSVETVAELPKDMNVLALFKFSDYENRPNDGERHFELGNLPPGAFPRERACSAYAVARNHAFGAPIFCATDSERGWERTNVLRHAWTLLFREAQWLGASSNQLAHLTVQLRALDDWPETKQMLDSVFQRNMPALDVYVGSEYALTPHWYFGKEGESLSFTGKQTVYPVREGFVRAGTWVFSSGIPLNDSDAELARLEAIVRSVPGKLLFVRVRVVAAFYREFVEKRLEALIKRFQCLVLAVPCAQLLSEHQLQVSLTLGEAENE